MKIIKLEAGQNGARPPLQDWEYATPPEGYAICPDELSDVFYSTTPAGFVTLTVDGNIVTDMDVNQEALDAYLSALPEPEPEPDPEPTAQDDTDAMLVDHEYRLTLLELGVTEEV